MKILISHDVDHLFASDHLARDLILPKLWVRSLGHLCTRRLSPAAFLHRLTLPLHGRMHRIDELMAFDRANGIPSVFFFGMDRALGMSYGPERAAPLIRRVLEAGFDAGVHGVSYTDQQAMAREHDRFAALSGLTAFGVRNHYVRFRADTFEKQARAGYLFGSTWFDRSGLELRAPFRAGGMWEIPLHIMDGYICRPGRLEQGLEDTFAAVERAQALGLPYCTILFHDYLFDQSFDPQSRRWYLETVAWLQRQGYEFLSYRDAVRELEETVC